jgi:hypothetical protein
MATTILREIYRKTEARAEVLSQELCDYPTQTKLPCAIKAAEPDEDGGQRFEVTFIELSEAQVRELITTVRRLG